MACFYPLDAWQNPHSGELRFKDPRVSHWKYMRLPCSQCSGCRLEYSRQWAVRCMHEASLYGENNSFITLTYNEEFVPHDFSLRPKDFTDFMKRLRAHFAPQRIRYYMCGEYGELHQRPHFHACLFNCYFSDRYAWRKSDSGETLYRSPTIEKLWTFGHVEMGDVTFESAAYVARYMMKKVRGDMAHEHYKVVDSETGEIYWRVPEYARMSLKPGIGAAWFDKYKAEVFPLDRVVSRGIEVTPPRYYLDLLRREDEAMYKAIKEERYKNGKEVSTDNTVERLRVKEVVHRARVSKLKRN